MATGKAKDSEAYNAGFEARRMGDSLRDCPYGAETWDADQWHYGFSDAEKEQPKRYYYAEGSVRGACGHRHRTIESVARCIARDQFGCADQGGFSDRYVRTNDWRQLDAQQRDDIAARVADELDRLSGTEF